MANQLPQEYCVGVVLQFDYLWKGQTKRQEINPQIDQGAIDFHPEKNRGDGEIIGDSPFPVIASMTRLVDHSFFLAFNQKSKSSSVQPPINKALPHAII